MVELYLHVYSVVYFLTYSGYTSVVCVCCVCVCMCVCVCVCVCVVLAGRDGQVDYLEEVPVNSIPIFKGKGLAYGCVCPSIDY